MNARLGIGLGVASSLMMMVGIAFAMQPGTRWKSLTLGLMIGACISLAASWVFMSSWIEEDGNK